MAASSLLLGVVPTLMGVTVVGGPAAFVPLALFFFIADVPGTH